jgi:transcription initiation factor TFIIIB Brf1 subunit/transcription initiation factor TFIIB
MQCGLVAAEAAVDTGPEYRVFDAWEVSRVRASPLRPVAKTDMAVAPEHGAQWRKLSTLHRKALHDREMWLVIFGSELKRVRECAGLPQKVVEEAEALVKKHLSHVADLQPEAVAVAVLWVAARAAGAPWPLVDFLKCSKADEQRVRRAAWRLMEVAKVRRPGIEKYVKTLAARVGLPAHVVKVAVDILERNRRLLVGRNPWLWAAAALWKASPNKLGLAWMLAVAAGVTANGVEDAARRLKR